MYQKLISAPKRSFEMAEAAGLEADEALPLASVDMAAKFTKM